MTLVSWLILAGISLLGAMSPGPSLAVILQNRIQRDLPSALVASWAHAVGIFFWALAASTGLGALFRNFPVVKAVFTVIGAIFLVYLAVHSWKLQPMEGNARQSALPPSWLSGIGISFFNPKIFVFFTALFSQFLPENPTATVLFGMALLAFLTDGSWYSLVSFLIGRSGLDTILKRYGLLVNRLAAVLYVIIALVSSNRLLWG